MTWPQWLDDAGLMAKSKELGNDTLAKHTWDVLARLADQYRLRPLLHEQLGDERLWHRLYWGCFLHDFGKAARDFQAILKGERNLWSEYGQRHEVLSLAFVDWLFPKGHIDRQSVIGVIVCHHRDLDRIFDVYGGRKPLSEESAALIETATSCLNHLAQQIDRNTLKLLWLWISKCSTDWAETLGIPILDGVVLSPIEAALSIEPRKAIFTALRDVARWLPAQSNLDKSITMIARGLILTADHAASAGTGAFPDMPLNRACAEKPTQAFTLRQHQQAARDAGEGSFILIAPTGSGKTEAALLWAAHQMALRPAARLFYTLPYQASMNAMADRLWERYFRPEGSAAAFTDEEINQTVMIQHSRATLHLYQMMMDADSGALARAAAALAVRQHNRAQLNYYPVQIFSPYQMLKAAFSLKGYEALLLDYTGALFIFDEIHAYDPERLALIVEAIRWLRETFGARFFVMTATLPPHLQAKLMGALRIGGESVLSADATTFAESQRHIVRLIEGTLLENIDRILEDYQANKTVLVCCNQVKRALEIYDRLRDAVGEDRVLLLHSRFNGGDRSAKEDRLMNGFNLRAGEQRSGGRMPCIVVATQVIEVSLDVDFDAIYTDPAPLEALIQRFGRVNRARVERMLVDVYVMRQPAEGKDTLPYDERMVRRSLDVLERRCADAPIDEATVSAMLGEIYEGSLLEEWERRFAGKQRDIRRTISAIQPFQSADESTYERFYEMFDGIQVIPEVSLNDCWRAYDEGGILNAARYFVNISARQYAILKGQGRVLIDPQAESRLGRMPCICASYDPDRGLDLYAASGQEDTDE